MGFYDASTGDLVTYWKTQSGITALVGSGTAARIYPEYAKESAQLPYVIYQQADGGEDYQSLSQMLPIRRSVCHVYCCATTQAGADALAEQVRLSTANHRGAMGTSTVHDVAQLGAPDTGHDVPSDASDDRRYFTRLVFSIHYGITAIT